VRTAYRETGDHAVVLSELLGHHYAEVAEGVVQLVDRLLESLGPGELAVLRCVAGAVSREQLVGQLKLPAADDLLVQACRRRLVRIAHHRRLSLTCLGSA
jgi:hypothetical protein